MKAESKNISGKRASGRGMALQARRSVKLAPGPARPVKRVGAKRLPKSMTAAETRTFNMLFREFKAHAATVPVRGAGPLSIAHEMWDRKYRLKSPIGESTETSPSDTVCRMLAGVFYKDPKGLRYGKLMVEAILSGYYMPGGRILAGAGTGRWVTLINCYVSATIEDSLDSDGGVGIFDALKQAALTMQQGGGIGMDFSTIRPKKALVKGVGADSSGPLSFMKVWDSMCETIKSAGDRRGAMMATLADDHPDLEDFIEAKHTQGVLTNFNLSILVSDAFMAAVKADGEWRLGHWKPPTDPKDVVEVLDREHRKADGSTEMRKWYVWKVLQARSLWDRIMKSTFMYAEPGIIFIDRVNKRNNLWYCEVISCTNPCGEQGLPPYSVCNLGAAILASFVREPFTDGAFLDYDAIEEMGALAVRLHDNVIDVTNFPLAEQEAEAQRCRRTGIGWMAIGNALQMLRVEYGSKEAEAILDRAGQALANGVYMGSVELAKERGAFPDFDAKKYLQGYVPSMLRRSVRRAIAKHGIRNGVMLTVAPTGTTAMFAALFAPWAEGSDALSGGLEPVFAHRYTRKVTQSDGSKKDAPVFDAGFVAWCRANGKDPISIDLSTLPPYMETAQTLPVGRHIAVQSATQKWIDASISKTINCPTDITFEDFTSVYMAAYDGGCKGCTTYRESGVRGSVLSVEPEAKPAGPVTEAAAPKASAVAHNGSLFAKRPSTLPGVTERIEWPGMEEKVYLSLIDDVTTGGDLALREVFINTKDQSNGEYIGALMIALSKLAQSDPKLLRQVLGDLKRINSATGGAWHNKVFYPSLVSRFAGSMLDHLDELELNRKATLDMGIGLQAIVAPTSDAMAATAQVPAAQATEAAPGRRALICPKCGSGEVTKSEGCEKCLSCGHSKCG